MSSVEPVRPAFTGVSIYNHPSQLVGLWYASEWQVTVEDTPMPSITITPDPADPLTQIGVTVIDLESPLTRKERASVLEGIRKGLAGLPNVDVTSFAEFEEDDRWGVEWQCTFTCEGGRCRRRARLFIKGRYQYAIVLQGSSEERYTYWQGMMEWTMLTLSTGPATIF